MTVRQLGGNLEEKLLIALYYRQLSAENKIINCKIETSFVSPKGLKAQTNRTGILLFNFNIHGKLSAM